jgi:hypothetical protein
MLVGFVVGVVVKLGASASEALSVLALILSIWPLFAGSRLLEKAASALVKVGLSMVSDVARANYLLRVSRQRIESPPGYSLRRMAEVLFSKKTMTEVFEPTLLDLETEYQEALSQGRPGKARWITIRGYWSFWSAVAAQAPLSLLKRVFELWKAA